MAQILIIDDDENFRAALKEMLSRAGYDVLEANNGQAGIELYRQQKPHPDLVITDILMPEKDGAQLIFDLNKEFPSIKIIAMSGGGVGAPEDYLKEISALSDLCHTLTKPFTMDELLQAVKNAVG